MIDGNVYVYGDVVGGYICVLVMSEMIVFDLL